MRHATFFSNNTYTAEMVMHQYVAASLGLLSLAAIAGAGVGVGSGVGMMAMAMAEEEAKQVCCSCCAVTLSVAVGPLSLSCTLLELFLLRLCSSAMRAVGFAAFARLSS